MGHRSEVARVTELFLIKDETGTMHHRSGRRTCDMCKQGCLAYGGEANPQWQSVSGQEQKRHFSLRAWPGIDVTDIPRNVCILMRVCMP